MSRTQLESIRHSVSQFRNSVSQFQAYGGLIACDDCCMLLGYLTAVLAECDRMGAELDELNRVVDGSESVTVADSLKAEIYALKAQIKQQQVQCAESFSLGLHWQERALSLQAQVDAAAKEDVQTSNSNSWVKLLAVLRQLDMPEAYPAWDVDEVAAHFVRGLARRAELVHEEKRQVEQERDKLKQAAINAGHALCALAKDEPSTFSKSIVDRQIRALTELTGHDFHW